MEYPDLIPFPDRFPAVLRPIVRYLHHLFVAVDQVVTAAFGGYPDETVSSYLWRLDVQDKLAGRILRPVVDTIWFWEDNHCYNAHRSERMRYHQPPANR